MSKDPDNHSRTDAIHPWEQRDTLYCAGLLLLGMALRVWNLADQSVWYDEWITLRALGEATLAACIRKEIELDFSMVPAYHVLQYFWAKWVSSSDYGIRWLSLLFAAASFPLLYAIARRMYGRGAAVVALLVMALAPYQIFHAQGIRNYSLALFAGLLSVYAYLRCLPSGSARRWWVLNVLANTLLLWTHLFGAFLFAVQGIHLLLFRRKPPRAWLLWGVAHVLIVLPVGLWQWTLPGNATYPDVPRPPLTRLYTLLAHHYTHPFEWVDYSIPTANTHEVLTPLGAALGERNQDNGFFSLRMRGANALHKYTAALLLLFLAGALWRARSGVGEEASRATLLLLWAVLPALGIFLIAWLFQKEAAFERYLIYAYPALYIALGAAVMCTPLRWAQAGLTFLLVALLSLQALAYQVIPIRQDYRSLVDSFQRQASPESPVIAFRYTVENLFRYNLHEPTREIARADSYEQLVSRVDEQLSMRGDAWVVLPSMPPETGTATDEHGLGERLLATCAERGWQVKHEVYGGMSLLWLLHIQRGDGSAPGEPKS